MRTRNLSSNNHPEFNLYAGFDLAPPLDWPELNRIVEVNANALRKMTFRRIEEMLRLARTQPSTTAPVIKVDCQSGSLVLLPFVDADGYKSVMFQLVEGDVNEGFVPDGQIQFDPRKWRTK